MSRTLVHGDVSDFSCLRQQMSQTDWWGSSRPLVELSDAALRETEGAPAEEAHQWTEAPCISMDLYVPVSMGFVPDLLLQCKRAKRSKRLHSLAVGVTRLYKRRT